MPRHSLRRNLRAAGDGLILRRALRIGAELVGQRKAHARAGARYFGALEICGRRDFADVLFCVLNTSSAVSVP